MGPSIKIVTLCTGNVARSVMLAYMLTTISEANGAPWQIRSAGTHVIEGSAMSARTRDALLGIDELGHHHYNAHRSHQLNAEDVHWADVVLASEASHVNYVRTHFADATSRVVQLHQFIRFAPLDEPLETQVRDVASMQPQVELDVVDPAGGDDATYRACANELWEMAQVFATIVGG
ncbi:MAG: arsenate reductase/protein-tyrosine-phosphatase family protein [Acidimicrobiales bacterium]